VHAVQRRTRAQMHAVQGTLLVYRALSIGLAYKLDPTDLTTGGTFPLMHFHFDFALLR